MGIIFRNSEIQYEISEIQYENMGFFPIFSKNPRISYHINMSRKVFYLSIMIYKDMICRWLKQSYLGLL